MSAMGELIMHAGTRWTFIISESSTASNSTPMTDNKQSRTLTVTRKTTAHTMPRKIACNHIPMLQKWCLYASSKTTSVSDRVMSSGVVSESLRSVPPSSLYASTHNSNSEVFVSLITITTKIFFSYTHRPLVNCSSRTLSCAACWSITARSCRSLVVPPPTDNVPTMNSLFTWPITCNDNRKQCRHNTTTNLLINYLCNFGGA